MTQLLEAKNGKLTEQMKHVSKSENIDAELIKRRVAGEYDVVVRVHVKNLENLLKVTNKIHMIEGVRKTTTQVIEKEIAL